MLEWMVGCIKRTVAERTKLLGVVMFGEEGEEDEEATAGGNKQSVGESR